MSYAKVIWNCQNVEPDSHESVRQWKKIEKSDNDTDSKERDKCIISVDEFGAASRMVLWSAKEFWWN